jgi:hypothetical protein
MQTSFLPVALLALAASVSAQARLDDQLLFPTCLIPPARISDLDCPRNPFVSAARFAEVSPRDQQSLVALANQLRVDPSMPHSCWLGPVPNATMALWNAVMSPASFNPVTRWSQTASQGGGLGNGDRTTITYSFVPDGTTIPAANGSPAGPSVLFATFNAVFPSQAIWQARIGDAMNRWGQLAGLTYVFEPNDDGSPLAGAAGQLGVRGDVRISAKVIDGGSGILAYNYFPNNGDMVLDSGDAAFYANAGSNYLRLFNVLAHEHGHGLGIAHVCPTNNTKLMEPFINLNFNGPQYDDILTAQRLYGDFNENNDTPALATDLGALANGTDTTTLQSLDGIADVDFFRFTIGATRTVGVNIRPNGAPYLEGDQNGDGSCQPGVNFDPRLLRNLGVSILSANGTVLAISNSAPAGSVEALPAQLLTAGTYFVRVFGDAVDQVQLYNLEVVVADAPPFTVSIVGGPPVTVPADAPAVLGVAVAPGTLNPDPSSGVLFASIDGGPFAQSPLQNLGGQNYRGLLPAAPCFATIRWYVRFAPIGGGTPVFAPFAAPASTFETDVLNLPLVTVFADNFQANLGWTVVNDAALTDGAWDRGVPVGGGDRGDPVTDGDGSGACYLTDNVDGNSDVDGGATRLLSPLINLAGVPDAFVTYQYWYTNNTGTAPNQDTWLVEISNNAGATWTTVQSTTASTTAWTEVRFRVTDFVAPTNLVRMRFTAQDLGTGSVVEAGVDGFSVQTCAPSATVVLPGACGGPFALSTIATSAAPIAGTSITIQCNAAATSAGPVFQGFVLGLGQLASPLPGCSCVLQPSLDLVDLQIGSWTVPGLQSWSLPLALPPSAAGLVVYAQGIVASVTGGSCNVAGLGVNLTDALRITVQ